MNNRPTNDNLMTRIIPGLTSQYQIVSLPYWAWYWLEDFMKVNRISYHGIYETFGDNGNLNDTLRNLAELHHEYSMREVYNLANDNEPDDDVIIELLSKNKNKMVKSPMKLPRIYKLFGFMSCATTLEAVWERRNYEESNKVN